MRCVEENAILSALINLIFGINDCPLKALQFPEVNRICPKIGGICVFYVSTVAKDTQRITRNTSGCMAPERVFLSLSNKVINSCIISSSFEEPVERSDSNQQIVRGFVYLPKLMQRNNANPNIDIIC